MLLRAHRFHGYGSLRFVYKNGQNVSGQLMGIRSCVNPRRKNYRIAVAVSKKVHKSAVVRNRIRRRIFELCRLRAETLLGGHDIVITIYSDTVATMPAAELKQQFDSLLNRAELVKTTKRPLQP